MPLWLLNFFVNSQRLGHRRLSQSKKAKYQMDYSFNCNVTAINADPFVYEPMEFVRDVVAEFAVVDGNMSFLAQVLAVVITELEYQVLMAKLTNCTHVFHVKLTVAEALQRSRELQQLALS